MTPPRAHSRSGPGPLAPGDGAAAAASADDPRVFAEQVRMLYQRAGTAQLTVVVNALLVAWVFEGHATPGSSAAWVATLAALAAARMLLVSAYRRPGAARPESARAWAHRFAAGAAATGACWGAAALVFHAPQSPAHQVFLAFVLGGMTAGAASSNASYAPAFAAFAAPALLPMIVRLAGQHDRVGAAMAFMLALFGVAVAALSRSGGKAISEALVLRFRNEALVDGLRATQERLETLNATLERRVDERTAELERMLGLRVRAEEALRQSEQRLRQLADSMHPLAWTARPDGHVTWYNRRWYEYTGTTPEQVEGWGWQAVYDPAALPEVLRRWKDALARGATLELEVRLRGADGRYRSFLMHVFPLKDRAGAVTQWFGTHADVTELVEARELLRRSDRQKGQFIAVLSHELRNPLAAIRSSLYLMERAQPESATFGRAREIVERQTAHLARLVDDLLDVARISRGTIELRLQRVDASEIVGRVCDDHRASFHDRRLELRAEVSGPAWVDADPTRLAQVVGNLLHNAMKFSREGGAVVVRVEVRQARVEIRVRDEGVGIPPELLRRLFEPFTQAAAGPARTNAGLGLGLALAHAIVELHGGSLRAHSEGRDRGAEFVVTLPLAAAPAQPEAAPAPLAPGASSAARPALDVLVVEDDVDIAQPIAEVLAIEGHRVHVATDARSGIARARELRPDVVLCDIGLPDADGHEVARALRADGTLGATRLIALSGYAQPEDRARAAQAGFDEHIAKPVPIEVLLAALHPRGSPS